MKSTFEDERSVSPVRSSTWSGATPGISRSTSAPSKGPDLNALAADAAVSAAWTCQPACSKADRKISRIPGSWWTTRRHFERFGSGSAGARVARSARSAGISHLSAALCSAVPGGPVRGWAQRALCESLPVALTGYFPVRADLAGTPRQNAGQNYPNERYPVHLLAVIGFALARTRKRVLALVREPYGEASAFAEDRPIPAAGRVRARLFVPSKVG